MKNFFKSRGFIVTALSVLCIAILGICWFVNRDKNNEFVPDESPPSTVSQEWTGLSSESEETETETDTTAPPTSPSTENNNKDYPKVVETESDQEVVIEFAPTKKAEETQPPAPEGKTIIEDPGPQHPVNPVPDVTVPSTEVETASTPSPGSSNDDGAYYDPVFGWVKPGEVNQSMIDSDGDPNKMVGNMGD